MPQRIVPILPICVDEYLPGEQFDKTQLPSSVDLRSTSRNELALAKYRLWESNQVLGIRFIDGDKDLHKRVEAYARKWLEHANLTFEFGNYTNADIRITFIGSGYRSLVGTDAKKCPDPTPTMTLGGFTSHTDDLEMQRVVLHEFGHALGCVHEQANPMKNIPWDEEKVYAYYMYHYRWDKAKVDWNVLKRYSESEVHFTQHDAHSIMQYPVSKELTRDNFEIGWNTTLSEVDKLFIKAMYPPKRSISTQP
jgi:hypothetical protein